MDMWAAIENILCEQVKKACQIMTTGTSGYCGATPVGLEREGVVWAYWYINDVAFW